MKSKATNDLPEIEWEDLQQELLESDPDERMAVYKTTGVDANGNEYTGSAYFFSDELDEIKDIELIIPKKTEGRGKTAMQQAIEKVEQMISIRNFQQWEQLKKQFLELEKQQITGSIVQGIMKDHGLPYGIEYLGKVADAEQYAEDFYTTTYTL